MPIIKDNLELYNKFRSVPQEAVKPISAGRLKGKSDINPMWRIKQLTEVFGPCGFGWRYIITRQWTETGANGEVSAFVNIDLYVKIGEKWSEAIPGTGGAAFVANERNGSYTSDECYKMALTDAISVACKALGVAADIYFANDRTKYDNIPQQPSPQPLQQTDNRKVLPETMFNDSNVMKWLYDKESTARASGLRVSLAACIEQNYRNTKEEISRILSNYEQYKINNNLT